MLDIHFSRPARKFLEKADQILARRLWDAINALQNEPFPTGVKRVENQWFENEKIFRIRVGDYRILYTVNYQKGEVLVVDIDKRPRVY